MYSPILVAAVLFFGTAGCHKKKDITFTPISLHLKYISKQDKFILENFFWDLVRHDGLGYVLFGSKPICLAGYFDHTPLENLLLNCAGSKTKIGWETWKKYAHLFPRSNFLIFEEQSANESSNLHSIYFVNKANLLRVLEKNIEHFQVVLGKTFKPSALLNK